MATRQLKLPIDTPFQKEITEGLAVQYRPQEFEMVYGNEHVVQAIKAGLKSNRPPRAYAFIGPYGCGKTTLARLIAKHHEIPKNNIVEVDAATYSSIDNIRKITDTIKYVGGGANRRIIIIDEAHGLSRQAWDALLKPIEEARPGLYWAFCTTQGNKVPDTILSRCQCYKVTELTEDETLNLIDEVNVLEGLECGPKVLDLIVKHSGGTPRTALQMLEQCRGLTEEGAAEKVLANITSKIPAFELIQMICSKRQFTWSNALRFLRQLEQQEPESTRLICLAYASKMLLGSKDEKQSVWLLSVLDAFSKPMYGSEKMAPLLLAVGQLCFGEEAE